MDKDKGAIPKGKTPFLRSAKTMRSPQKTNKGNESTYHCEMCMVGDDQPIVRCDKCHLWYHFKCVGVPKDVGDYDWFCSKCTTENPIVATKQTSEGNEEQNRNVNVQKETGNPSGYQQVSTSTADTIVVDQQVIKPTIQSRSRKSKSGTSTSSRRRTLALEKLEEERKLELEEREKREKSNKEYLDKKYSILEQDESDIDDLSFDDQEVRFESIKQWAENVSMPTKTALDINKDSELIPQMSSTEANFYEANEQVQDENDQEPELKRAASSESIFINIDADNVVTFREDVPMFYRSEFMKLYNQDVRISGPHIQRQPSLSHQWTKENDQPAVTSNQYVPTVALNAPQTQPNSSIKAVNDNQVASYMSVSQQINSQASGLNVPGVSKNQTFTPHDTNRASFGRQMTSQAVSPQIQGQQYMTGTHVRSQFGYQSVYRPQPFVHQNQQSLAGAQMQSQPSCSTQSFVNQCQPQQALVTNHMFAGRNKPSQTFTSISQPAMNRNVFTNNQPPMSQRLIGGNRYFSNNNQPPVTTNPSISWSQSANFNQPVISTQGYQTSMFQQPIVSNYHQPIMSTGIPNQSMGSQPVSISTSVPYVSGRMFDAVSSNIGDDISNHGGIVGAYDNYEQNGMMAMQNLMSRQVIDKRLPIFAGNPEEWDAWYNRYLSTTTKCKLDNSENLDRLVKCLKGKAHDIVKSKLGQTEAVPWIIRTLQKVFGRPETVLKTVMKRIREIPPIKNDNLKSMMEFAFEVQSVTTTIESSGLISQYSNPMLLEDLVEKLPAQLKLEWARYKRGNQNVTVKTFTEWLDELADDISTVIEPTVDKYNHKKSDKRNDKASDKDTAHVNIHVDGGSRNKESAGSADASRSSKLSSSCLTCGKGCQRVENCSTFNSLTVEGKWQEIKIHKLCRLCLKKHKFPCKSTNICGKNGCSIKHHQLLHNDERHLSKDNQKTKDNVISVGNNFHYEASEQVMLKYLPVVLHKNNKKIKTTLFFDDGSQASMMEQSLADELGVHGTREQLCLLWTDNIHRKEDAQRISIEISGENDLDRRYPLNGIRAVKSLHLPAQTFNKEDLIKRYPHLINVPMGDYENSVPGILIGSDFPKLGVQLKTIEGKAFKSPIASKTRLGWVVYGPRGGSTSDHYVNNHQVVKVCPHHNELDHDVHQQIKEYFSIENFGVRANSRIEMESKDNQRALDLLKNLTIKVDGRYETGLLWKHDDVNKNLPDSYCMAMKRLISLEKQGERVVKTIGDKIADYVSKGYARKLSDEEIKNFGADVWYLPFFGVVHPKKPEKLRMVFDGAAKMKNVSLNSMLLTGPDELASLVDILRRLREKLFAAGGDVKEMYHQVKIRKSDQQYQLFLFRNGETIRKPDVYVMCVMTFGAKCSPAAAQYVKNTNAKKFKKTHPRAVEAIIDNHYVDDMMDGENTVDETVKMIQDVKMIHDSGGFEIRNFISNSPEVLRAIGVTNKSDGKEITLDSEMKTERVLGMWWNTKLDVFTFSLKYTLIAKEILDETRLPTKRELLRTLMSIFDPLGLLSNYLVQLKILLQDVWRTDLNWDEQISTKGLVNKWKQWLEFLPAVESVQVPRLYSLKLIVEKPKSVEIHIFVDASIDAFSAVTYLRIKDEDGVDCSLMGSKARVAPLKYLSVPRKELQSAVLGTRLMTSISEAQRFKIDRRVLWSDSETVLSWLKSDHRKYSQFVAHRVGEILESTDVNEWRWVPTKENVADEATKWSKSMNFKSSNRWFSGPEFLRLDEDKWQKKRIIKANVEEEMKAHCVHSSLVLPQLVNADRFSKWSRMVRTVAFSLRFRNLFKDKSCKGTPLSQEELSKAENIIFRQAQFEGYPSEMVTLERNKSLPLNKQKFIEKPSSLYDGSPYLDADGILRMRGRIDGARDLSLNSKRPIILPRDSRITRLLIHHYHARYFHQNHETVINEIRQRFYVPRLRVVLKKVRANCQMCKVKLAKPMEPQMADLPQARLATFVKPFSYVGVDYFGPMKVKIGRRNEKRWGVLFTCLTIRAVHIELVSSLNTDSCILCIGNFIADRGAVVEFHSDNGTNFVGANNELKRELEKLDPEKLQTKFTSRYTNWIFNPPAAPHMGGSWERLIRSVKSGIYNTLPSLTPKEETLRNILKEIQNVVNSRPLTFIPLEVEEDEALTPNHFLHGSSNGSKPPCGLNVEGEYLRKSWKEAQRLTELFWNRFVKEYLPTLARRTKWFKATKPLTPDDLVLVVDEKNPRNTYPKGKVLETKVGSNGQVRRAKIQMIAEAKIGRAGKICKVRKNELWRPAHKLAVLDVISKEDGLAHPKDRKTGGRMLEMNDNTDLTSTKLTGKIVGAVTRSKSNTEKSMSKKNSISEKAILCK